MTSTAQSLANIAKARAAGVPDSIITSHGVELSDNELQRALTTWSSQQSASAAPAISNIPTLDSLALSNLTAQQPQTAPQTSNIPTLDNLASQQYQFDPNQYLPQIQQTAASIYNPQQAQIEALRAISSNQTEQARATTKADYAKHLQSEIEAINRRGAFFSGGALKAETDIRTAETSALSNINLQEQATQAGFLAQQAGLSAAQAEYIQEKLTGAENSAYTRFQDYRNFLLNLTQAQRQEFESDREFQQNVNQFGLQYALDLFQTQRDIYESDRAFAEDVRQFGLEYALAKKKSKSSK